MSDEKMYEQMRRYIDLAVELAVAKQKPEVRTEPKLIEGPPGKDGKDGRDGKDGADGKPGERGADGIATRAELDALVEQRFADLQVRSLADSYEGVYQPDKDYTRGKLTTWGGSLFLALRDTRARPEQSTDWKLIVKRGADGKR